MTAPQPSQYSKEEVAACGKKLYESQIRAQVETDDNRGKIVAIDIETGTYKVLKNSLAASDLLLESYPNAQIWLVRIGHKAVHRIGAASSVPG